MSEDQRVALNRFAVILEPDPAEVAWLESELGRSRQSVADDICRMIVNDDLQKFLSADISTPEGRLACARWWTGYQFYYARLLEAAR